ncbi:MAG TPA: ABC transporter permease [Thermoanaerobaculia bacterium]|jgi:predicted permease|nr:ABC transporter permease [Thermoanaerobaculia bacterium]
MESIWKDLALSLRALRRSPAFTAAAIASLALGIGANTLIFIFLNAFFLKGLPVADPERLVAIYSVDLDKQDLLPSSYPNLQDLRKENKDFAGLAAYRNLSPSLTGDGEPVWLQGEIVSGNYFEVLGIRPARGRFFLPEEDSTPGGHPVAVLSYGLWQSHFGSDPKIVGRVVQINQQGFTVVGVAPPEFRGLSVLNTPPQIWVPIAMYHELTSGPAKKMVDNRGALAFSAVARLKPGVPLAEASLALKAFASRLEREFPDVNQNLGFNAIPIGRATLPPGARGRFVLSGGLLAAVVGLLLLIAGANVANLLLARALARSGEMAVRLSLGAGRGRLLRQLLTEGALLGLLGGVIGLAVAAVGRRLLWTLRPPFFPDSLDLGLDGRVLGFTLVVALGTGIVFSLAPAFQSFRLNLSSILTRQSRSGSGHGDGSGRLREVLIAFQVALSIVVLSGAALFVRSLLAVEKIDPGFETEKLFVVPFDLGARGYAPARAQEFYRQVVERVSAIPGVRQAAVANRFLLVAGGTRSPVEAEGQEARTGNDQIVTGLTTVGAGYFPTVGMRLRSGRSFLDSDREGTLPAVVINESLAHRLWPAGPALGKRLRFSATEGWQQVIGVVADSRTTGLREPPEPNAYRPVLQNYTPVMMLHVRTAAEPEPLLERVRREVQAMDPGLPLLEPRTIGQVRNLSLWAPRMGAGLLSMFGLLAMLLAALGVYGVVSYSVGQRRREIAIRMAIGAARQDVIRLILRQGMRPVIIGIAAGIAGALALARTVASLLFGIGAADPFSFGGSALLLALIALAAVYLPARRASGLDPLAALREG